MKTTQLYISPEIELIHLDREISLQLESATPFGDPDGPGWSAKTFENTNIPLQEVSA